MEVGEESSSRAERESSGSALRTREAGSSLEGRALKPSEVLDKAAELISGPGKWTQGTYARDQEGDEIYPLSLGGGVCFCALGATHQAAGQPLPIGDWERGETVTYLRRSLGRDGERVHTWNDAPGRTQEQVVDALKRAAELARSEGQ